VIGVPHIRLSDFLDKRSTAAAISGAVLGALPPGDMSPRAKARLLCAWLDGDRA
jgi:hypothetical protein